MYLIVVLIFFLRNTYMKNFTENDVRVAAYYNWLNSGCQNGNDLQNWNNALIQLSGKTTCSGSKTCTSTSSNKKSSSKKTKK